MGRRAWRPAWAMPASWAATISPAKTPVISFFSFRVTFTRKVGRVARATSRISSKMGLPTVSHQVAFGWLSMSAPWLLMMMSAPAMPGRTALPPPE
jgi:hypothetical protein